MKIKRGKFDEIDRDKFGVVLVGSDLTTAENRRGFVDGFTNLLVEEGVAPKGSKPKDLWESLYELTTTGGRTDLVFVARKGARFNIGRFAMVRLQMQGASWIDDWKDNYASHYGHAAGRFESSSDPEDA